jgi:hypothetical protein
VALAFAIIGLAVVGPAAAAQSVTGRWTLAPTRDDARLQLTLRDFDDWYNSSYSSSPVDPQDLRGLDASALRGRSHGRSLSVSELTRRRVRERRR